MKLLLCIGLMFCFLSNAGAADLAVSSTGMQLLTEDTTWSGTVVIKGSVVVAPQATLRISPGTVVRFEATALPVLPSLIVHGRILVTGTSDRPITLSGGVAGANRSSWGGVVLLSSEKKNSIDQCRIEGAETALDLRYSALTLKSTAIVQAGTAILATDSVLHMTDDTITECGMGVSVSTCELDGKNITIASCQRGGKFIRSGLSLSGFKLFNCQQAGVVTDGSRIKITGGEFVGNMLAARITGGEGQISQTRFQDNRETVIHLSGARIKIQRCLFTGNANTVLRTEDGQSLILNNSFVSNGGFNLYNVGREVIAAWQNWWGTTDPVQIGLKIYDATTDKTVAPVRYAPWLTEKPLLLL